MNIFALSDDPNEAAIWQHDKHVVKMTLETAQLLSTALWCRQSWRDTFMPLPVWEKRYPVYRPTHANHPSSKWCRETSSNFKWLVSHGYALEREYSRRFGRRHKSITQIDFANSCAKQMTDDELTPFAMAMPNRYKCDDPVLAYRLYYRNEKVDSKQKWTDVDRTDMPKWLQECLL